jgi:hypothetical protein
MVAERFCLSFTQLATGSRFGVRARNVIDGNFRFPRGYLVEGSYLPRWGAAFTVSRRALILERSIRLWGFEINYG